MLSCSDGCFSWVVCYCPRLGSLGSSPWNGVRMSIKGHPWSQHLWKVGEEAGSGRRRRWVSLQAQCQPQLASLGTLDSNDSKVSWTGALLHWSIIGYVPSTCTPTTGHNLGWGGSLQLRQSLRDCADGTPSSWDKKSFIEEGSGWHITAQLVWKTAPKLRYIRFSFW